MFSVKITVFPSTIASFTNENKRINLSMFVSQSVYRCSIASNVDFCRSCSESLIIKAFSDPIKADLICLNYSYSSSPNESFSSLLPVENTILLGFELV